MGLHTYTDSHSSLGRYPRLYLFPNHFSCFEFLNQIYHHNLRHNSSSSRQFFQTVASIVETLPFDLFVLIVLLDLIILFNLVILLNLVILFDLIILFDLHVNVRFIPHIH